MNDLLDDLNHEQLTKLLNWLFVHFPGQFRAMVKAWRKSNGL